jgi:hypothetical protein
MVWATSALPQNERFTGVGGGREAMADDAHGVRPMVTGSPFFSPFFIANFCLFCQKGKSLVVTAYGPQTRLLESIGIRK